MYKRCYDTVLSGLTKHIWTCLYSLSRGALIMNAASLPPVPDRQSAPLRTTVPEGATHSVPPPGPRRRNPWHGLSRWVQENTFAPEWPPGWLRHSLIGYLAAVLVQGAAVGVIFVVCSLVPDFDYFAIVALMGVVF